MTNEESDIENQIDQNEDFKHLMLSLGMNQDHFYRYKFEAVMGLQKFGGSFANALGKALDLADQKNAIKILNAFKAECSEHAMLFKIYHAKEKARNE